MVLKLYGLAASGFVRPLLLTLKALDVDYDFVEVNTMAGDQFKEEFLKLNPCHTIPTIEDGDFVLWESSAIIAYLVEKYGKDNTLYPKDLQKKAVVHKRLFFNCCAFFQKYTAVAIPVLKDGKVLTEESAAPLNEDKFCKHRVFYE